MNHYRVGVDIGGTFTDIVLLGDDDRLHTHKLLSTPGNYCDAIVEGLQASLRGLDASGAAVRDLVHATTVATNIILEKRGARTALITTAGFRDVLEMRRLRIPVLYDLQYRKPEPLVPRHLRYEVDERVGPDGRAWRPLREDDVRAVAEQLKHAEIDAVAVALLHAYANPEHERRIAEILRQTLGDSVFICCSADILAEIREYERTSTAVVNAYVGPSVSRYLGTLLQRLDHVGIGGPVQVMQSGGGIMPAAAASRKPAYIVESGPAAGVIACARLARRIGHANAISFDMGGTTAKAAIVEDGEPAKTTEFEVGGGISLSSKLVKGGGYAIKLPFIDVSEIGAGGGSIVALDETGALKVGPQSAGADPGPACYGRGGDKPTLTDCLVVLGHLNPQALAGGSVPIDAAAAKTVVARDICGPLALDLLDGAHGVIEIAAANMTRAVKAVSTYRGRDPRNFALIAFGGNGPVIAAAIARKLELPAVFIPPAPGVFSAAGLLFSRVERDFTETVFRRVTQLDLDAVEAAFRRLEDRGCRLLESEGYRRSSLALRRRGDFRYAGQAYELTVDFDATLAASIETFHREHERTFGYRSETESVDLINVRIEIAVEEGGRSAEALSKLEAPALVIPKGSLRDAYFGRDHGLSRTPVLARAGLGADWRAGPLIIEEYDATCIVPPEARARLDQFGNIEMRFA
ncbi:MAG: hydantoinase/oxoprolinase family protein [Parvibaculaceae bacterium]